MLKTALGLGAVAIPFLGFHLAEGTGSGEILALRFWGSLWAPLWIPPAVLVLWGLLASLRRCPRPPLPKGNRVLGLALLAAIALPFLPAAWMQAMTQATLPGTSFHPLGWLSLETLSQLWLYVILALGLDLVVGRTGVLVLGYGGFYAIGAYATALLATRVAFPYWAALGAGLVLGPLLAAAMGVLVGFPALRLKGDYLAIVTLGFGEILVLVLKNWESVTGGNNGVNITPALLKPLKGSWLYPSAGWHYGLSLAAAALAALFHHRLGLSRTGRAMLAVREDETAARAMGIDASRIKLLAFALAAGWAGVAGALFAARIRFVTPESFTFLESVIVLSMVVLGGMGSLRGVVFGAVAVTVGQELLRDLGAARMLIFGALLVGMVVLRPQGQGGKR